MSADHAIALAATGLAAAGLAFLTRRRPAGRAARAARLGLALLLLAGVAVYLGLEARAGELTARHFLPFHLCDLAIFVAAYALLARGQLATEIVYYWALSGTLLAIVTPDVPGGFPDPRWLAYFGLHGAVVVAAVTLVFGHSIRPRRGSSLRVFGITLAYALLVGLVDFATDSNFLYLRHKPAEPTLLDHFGPWPVYLGVCGILGLALFTLLERLTAGIRAGPGAGRSTRTRDLPPSKRSGRGGAARRG